MGEGSVIVIGGGVGPMAGVALHAKIIEQTLGDGTDQSHICVHHYSCPALVPDRTAYLLGGGEDPAAGMAGVFEAAARALSGHAFSSGDVAVGGVPCNTFHAPAIYDRFAAMVAERARPIRLVNMLSETVTFLGASVAPGSTIGVLSTTGTRKSGVYGELLARAGYAPLLVSEEEQALVHAAIYDTSWGIKATSTPSDRARQVVADMAGRLAGRGAAAVILACTELPLALQGTSHAGAVLVDPVLALARALVREAAPDKLRPLNR